MQIETLMSDFSSEAELEQWLVDIVHERWGVSRKLRNELMRAWVARLESIRLGYEKDYVIVVDVKAYLRRQGPKRPARLARQMEQQQEQWRELREGGGDG